MRRSLFAFLIAFAPIAFGVMEFGAAHAALNLALVDFVRLAMHGSLVAHAGPGLALVVGFVTAPGATLTAWGLGSGDSLTVQNCPLDKKPRLLNVWGDWQTAGYLSIFSTKFNDAVKGLQFKGVASAVTPLMPMGVSHELTPQDLLTAKQSGSATAGDIETGVGLIYYPELPGINARLLTYEQFMQRATGIIKPVENTLALGTVGGYSGAEAINAEEDYLKANTDYALMGYQVDVECAAVGWRGPDTGNLRVGGPGNPTLKHLTGDWFIRLAKAFNLPLIPVISSANRGATLIDGVQDENGADPLVNTTLMELRASA